MHPRLAWILAALVGGILLADRGLASTRASLALALLLLLGAALRPRWPLWVALVGAIGAASHGARLDAARHGRPERGLEVTLDARVERVSRGPRGFHLDLAGARAVDPGGTQLPARIRVRGEATPGPWPALEDRLPGERVRARLRLRAPTGRRNPGRPDPIRRVERQGIGAVARLVHPALHVALPGGDAGRAAFERRRRRAVEALAARGPGGALLAALGLGEREALDPTVREGFARLGLAHLLAVSGLHLALVAGMVFAFAAGAAVRCPALAARLDPRRLAIVCALAAAVPYAALTGGAVPVRRALVLLALLAALALRRRPTPSLQPLGLAVLAVLAAEPAALFEPGAQLSFAATAGLLLARSGPVREGPLGLASETLRTSATALAATAPLAALHFGSVAPAAPLANLLAVPWTASLLLPAALALSLAELCGAPLPEPLAQAACRLAEATLDAVAAAAARLPSAAGRGVAAPGWLLAALALGAAALAQRRTGARLAAVGLQSALLLAAPAAPIAPLPPRLVALDVGQGDALLLQGRRASVLVDGGTAVPGGVDLGERVVVPALRALGVARLDVVVASHADLDHRGGLPAVLERLPVGALWLPAGSRQDPGFAALLDLARRRGVPVRERGRGDPVVRLGDLTLATLWPPRCPPGSGCGGAARNDRSLVLRARLAGRSVLLPGDIEAAVEERLVAATGALGSDVLVLPHHGSRSSSTRGFLAAVAPRLALASAPRESRFGMPDPQVRARLAALGVPLAWTGRDGALLVGLGPQLTLRRWARLEGPQPLASDS